MALGRRKGESQQELFVTADRLPKSIGHVFYRRLNELLAEAGFDRWVEDLCQHCYIDGKGRPGIPPGVFFRMLIVGHFECITPTGESRGAVPIVCRCDRFWESL